MFVSRLKMMRKYSAIAKALSKRHRSASTILNETTAPRKEDAEHIKFQGDNVNANGVSDFRGYNEVPGPKAIPLLGNSWRFLPFVGKDFFRFGSWFTHTSTIVEFLFASTGQYKLDEVDLVSRRLHKQYGDIVKIEKILGRPDMVFLFDADEIERVFRHEDSLPYRPSMPSLNYYKHVLRKDFFGDMGGVIAV